VARNPKGGRPKKAARLKRTWRLHVLLTASEYKALANYAGRKELTASEIVRGCIRTLLEAEAAKGGGQ
jgi:hypothetical protein